MSVKDALKKKKNILHLIIWILALIALALIAGLTCFKCYNNFFENQFIDATILGYFIVACFLLVGIFCEEEIPEKTMLAVSFLGAIMYLVSAILLILILNKTYFGVSAVQLDDTKGRTMGAMIVCLLLGIVFLIEFILSIAKPDLLKN